MRIKKVVSTVLCIVVLTVFLFGGLDVSAVESTKDSQLRSVHISDAVIEEATLVIGSHLIHIDGLTDELYAIAIDSASEYNQTKLYYKSELANGRWYEITNAVSIADITTAGMPVDRAVIEELEFTHKTDSHGITRDLRTGQVVNLFDIKSVYDPEAIEELEPVRLQYQKVREKDTKTPSDGIYEDMLYYFFQELSKEGVIRNARTNECDMQLKGLQAYKEDLIAREKSDSWVEITDRVMGQVDAERRYESLTLLLGQLETLLQYTYGEKHDFNAALDEKVTFEITEENPAGFIVNADVTDAVGQAVANVQSSIAKYSAKRLTEGTTAAAQEVYQYSNDLINAAAVNDRTGSDTATERLLNIDNILSDKMVNQESERSLLESDLVAAALAKYMEKLQGGVSAEYQTAVAEGAPLASRTGMLTQQKADTNAARQEYQSFLDGLLKRMPNAEAQERILQLIDEVPQMREVMPDDDVRTYHLETVEEHLRWLRTMLAEKMEEDNRTSESEGLKNTLDELEKQRQSALDKNDLAQERRLAAEMEAVQSDIDSMNADSLAILSSENASESDKAKALANLSDKSAAKTLSNLADEISAQIRGSMGGIGDNKESENTNETGNAGETGDEIGNGENDQSADSDTDEVIGGIRSVKSDSETSIYNMLDAFSGIAALDPDAAEQALDEIRDTLANAPGIDQIQKDALNNKIGDLSREISDAKGKQNSLLSTEELLTLIEEQLVSMDGGATDKNKAGILIALSMYAEDYDNRDARMLAVSLASQYASEKNDYIFTKYDKDTAVYVSLKSISAVLQYRYIFDDAQNTITLSKGKSYHIFNALYIRQEECKKLFHAKARYIESCEWAALKTADMKPEIDRVYNLMAGGA